MQIAHVLAIVIGVTGIGLTCEAGQQPPVKRSRPPKFDAATRSVFFDDARHFLVEEDNAERTPGVTPAAPATTQTRWSELIDSEAIEREIKASQIALSAALATSSAFRSGEHERARVQFSLLAALFQVASEHDQKIRFQGQGQAMAALMAQAAAACRTGTEPAFHQAKDAYEMLFALVRGQKPELKPVNESRAAFADRGALMKRLDQAAVDRIAVWTGDPNTAAQRQEDLEHESQLIAALAEVIRSSDYDRADEDTYRRYLREMGDAAIALRRAAGTKVAANAQPLTARLLESCTNCHKDYRD